MPERLDVSELLTGWPVRLRYVNRFSTSMCVRPENVAEHSYYVCLYSLAIVEWLLSQREATTSVTAAELRARVLSRAVMHDLEECRTGDIHRPFKYSTPELRETLEAAARVAIVQVTGRIFPDPGLGRDAILEYWRNSKASDEAGQIVKFADFLSVISFVKQEGPGAKERLCLDTMRDHAMSFEKDARYNFLRPLVEQAMTIVRETLDEPV